MFANIEREVTDNEVQYLIFRNRIPLALAITAGKYEIAGENNYKRI